MRKITEKTVERNDGALSLTSRIKGLRSVLGAILFLALLHNPIQALQGVTLAWDPSPDANVVGYAVYSGTNSGSYQTRFDTGSQTYWSIQLLTTGATYFFVVTAYTADGIESLPSNEVSYTVPNNLPTIALTSPLNGAAVLRVTGQIGYTYDIEATADFKAWTIIGTVTLGASGSLDFTDTNVASFPRRFYRTQQKP